MTPNVSESQRTTPNVSEYLQTDLRLLKTSQKPLENGHNVTLDIKVFLVQELYLTKKNLDLWV